MSLNRLDEALVKHNEAIKIAKRRGFDDVHAAALINIGKVYAKQGDAAKARDYYEQGKTMASLANKPELAQRGDDYLRQLP